MNNEKLKGMRLCDWELLHVKILHDINDSRDEDLAIRFSNWAAMTGVLENILK